MSKRNRNGWFIQLLDSWMFHNADDLSHEEQVVDLLKDIRRAVTIIMIVAIFILARSCDTGVL